MYSSPISIFSASRAAYRAFFARRRYEVADLVFSIGRGFGGEINIGDSAFLFALCLFRGVEGVTIILSGVFGSGSWGPSFLLSSPRHSKGFGVIFCVYLAGRLEVGWLSGWLVDWLVG